jgi:hypothetical protein
MLEGNVSRLEFRLKANYFRFDVFFYEYGFAFASSPMLFSPFCVVSYVQRYTSSVDPDFAALLPTVGKTGCIKTMFSCHLTTASAFLYRCSY